jgi:hypothetical protein
MNHSLPLLILLLTALPASATSCILVPFEQQLREANTVFVATVTSATSPQFFARLENGTDYRVNYSYAVRERVKGNPGVVKSLFTVNIYHAYDSDLDIQGAETRLLPGDNILVMASSPGEVQVAACTPSRLWSPTPELLRLLRSSQAHSNNSFKPKPLRGSA